MDDVTELPGGENVIDAVRAITGSGRSVFSYAIMSGKSDAVELIYRLVAGWEDSAHTGGIHPVDHEEVREGGHAPIYGLLFLRWSSRFTRISIISLHR